MVDDTQHTNTIASIPNSIPRTAPIAIHPGTLQLDESAEIKLVCQVTSAGTTDLHALVIASNGDSDDDIVTTPVTASLVARPSVVVTASSRPSRQRLGEHLVSVELTNVADRAIRVDKLSTISQTWKARDVEP